MQYETPNFIYLLYQRYQKVPWIDFLYRWEDILFSLISAAFIALLFAFGLKKELRAPKGLTLFLEWSVDCLDKLLRQIMEERSQKYLPFLGTLFLYIFCMNIWGLIPLMKTPSSNLSVTMALAICVFCYVQYLNIKNKGPLGFVYSLAGSPKNFVGWLIVPVMLPLEILTQLARPVTLALRLAGNMLGDHLLIVVFALLGFVWLPSYEVPLTIPIQIPIIFLAILTGFMQALVFTVLAGIYILLSFSEEH